MHVPPAPCLQEQVFPAHKQKIHNLKNEVLYYPNGNPRLNSRRCAFNRCALTRSADSTGENPGSIADLDLAREGFWDHGFSQSLPLRHFQGWTTRKNPSELFKLLGSNHLWAIEKTDMWNVKALPSHARVWIIDELTVLDYLVTTYFGVGRRCVVSTGYLRCVVQDFIFSSLLPSHAGGYCSW